MERFFNVGYPAHKYDFTGIKKWVISALIAVFPSRVNFSNLEAAERLVDFAVLCQDSTLLQLLKDVIMQYCTEKPDPAVGLVLSDRLGDRNLSGRAYYATLLSISKKARTSPSFHPEYPALLSDVQRKCLLRGSFAISQYYQRHILNFSIALPRGGGCLMHQACVSAWESHRIRYLGHGEIRTFDMLAVDSILAALVAFFRRDRLFNCAPQAEYCLETQRKQFNERLYSFFFDD
jgi:hypothetical protein